MLGENAFFFETGLGSPEPFAAPPPPDPSVFFPETLEPQPAAIPAYDSWGGIQIPTIASPAGYPAGDPTLRIVLDFFYSFAVTDQNATAAWAAVYPASPPLKSKLSTFVQDPRQLDAGTFSTSYLPALFMWRESASQDYAAEDWLRETTKVMALWILPLGVPSNQVQRVPFEHALVKAITVGLERGRTPGYIVPGDPDPQAAAQGSLMYGFAGFESFSLTSWQKTRITIESAADGEKAARYPGIEMTFTLEENLVYGLGRFAPNSPNQGVYATLVGPNGQTLVSGPF
jgi:hypothetical protein